jgi:hypothetical protein
MASTTTVTVEISAPTEMMSISLQSPPTSDREEAQTSEPDRVTTVIILATVTGVTIISSLLAGVVIVSLPEMAKDLHLSDSLLLWYVAPTYLQVLSPSH